MKTLTIKDETWEKLTLMKIKGKFKTLDEVIRYLLDIEKKFQR
jgi:predicted CopG family antitoxin